MLTLYRRHRQSCKNKADRYARKDRCPIWCEGVVEGEYHRNTLHPRSWERADELKREIEGGKREAGAAEARDARGGVRGVSSRIARRAI